MGNIAVGKNGLVHSDILRVAEEVPLPGRWEYLWDNGVRQVFGDRFGRQ